MKIMIATLKSWNIKQAEKFKKKFSTEHEIKIIGNKEDFSFRRVDLFKPDYIFFPHWSYIIPDYIYRNYTCVVFHMTDLPFGRGGSPLQNLIVRGIKETKISAIKVEKEIDAGDVYLKESLSLSGSAEEIYIRASEVIFNKMIPQFLETNLQLMKQQGIPVYFKRRTAEESELNVTMSLDKIYDYIRMLDAEGYPNAYIKFGRYKLTFNHANFDGEQIRAEVNIREEKESCIQS